MEEGEGCPVVQLYTCADEDDARAWLAPARVGRCVFCSCNRGCGMLCPHCVGERGSFGRRVGWVGNKKKERREGRGYVYFV